MKKLAIVIAASALIGTPAFVQASPPAPVYNWTGWYVGVNAGASMGNVKTDFNGPFQQQIFFTKVVNFGTFEGLASGSAGFTSSFAGSNTESPSGFIGGGQIGYNWQLSPIWVVGVEADFQGAVEKDSNTQTSNFSQVVNVDLFAHFDGSFAGTQPIFVTGSTVLDYQTKIDWFGTVRGRIGYVWGNGEVMSYLTGGLAYGRVGIEGAITLSGSACELSSGCQTLSAVANPPFSTGQAFGHSQVNIGWVVGYGTEGHLPLMPGNWTWKIEGLYMDLGTLDTGAPAASATTGCTNPLFCISPTTTVGPLSTHSHFTDGILRAGLNYKFY